MKGLNYIEMREYSFLLRKYYDTEDVIPISNMKQIGFYLSHSGIEDHIMDINVQDGRVYFFIKKSDLTKEIYKEWQNRPRNESGVSNE